MVTTTRWYRVSGGVPLSVASTTSWIVCPATASAGTCRLIAWEAGSGSLTSPIYVSTSFHRHHLTVTALPSGSDVTASRRTVVPGRAEIRELPRSMTCGSGFAPAYVGVTDHIMRAASAFCAAGVKFGLGEGGREAGGTSPAAAARSTLFRKSS